MPQPRRGCRLAALLLALALALPLPRPARAWRQYKAWSTRNWCEQVIDPLWPYAYSKNTSLSAAAAVAYVELKGRTASNFQDMGHECTVQGAQSRCSICETIACGAGLGSQCAFQVQGISWLTLPVNVPTASDTPFAVGPAVLHRNDFANAQRVCVITSSTSCQASSGRVANDYSACAVRCWGQGDPAPVPAPFGWTYSAQRGGALQGRVMTLAGRPPGVAGGGPGFLDGPSSSALFNNPQGLAVDAQRFVYVADTENHAIRRISPGGDVITLAGAGVAGYLDGSGAQALFSHPVGVSVQLQCGGDGSTPGGSTAVPYGLCATTLVVADSMNHRIRRISCTTNNLTACFFLGSASAVFWAVSTVAGGGNTSRGDLENQASGLADGFAQFARFDTPMGVASDTSGNIFVADTRNQVIRWINRDGFVKTLFGKVLPYARQLSGCPFPCLRGVPGYLDANATESQFYSPYAVAIGPGRPYTLLVADGDRVRLLTRSGQRPFADSAELRGPGFAQGATADEVEQLDAVVTLAGGSGAAAQVHDVPDGQVSWQSDGRRPGLADGMEDGHGYEAHFDKPRGVAMAVDGRIYVADSSRCRLRSVTVGAQVARALTCSQRLVDVVRPSGCTGLDAPTDLVDRLETPAFGYELYNYNTSNFFAVGTGGGPMRPDTQNWLLPGSWADELSAANDATVLGDGYLGSGVDGRRTPYCMGAPPPDIGLTMAPPAAQRYNGTAEVTFELDEDTSQGTRLVLSCPPSCVAASAGTHVIGGLLGEYGDESPLCAAAVHAGALADSVGGVMIATLRKGYGPLAGRLSPLGRDTPLDGSTAHGVTSLSVPSATRTFSVAAYALPLEGVEVQTIAGAPAAPLERGPCGFEDGEPPLSARFNGPAALAIFFNASLSRSELLFVADAHNHVVRAVTAICSQTCENGGVCTAAETCTCPPGWAAPDCTQPVCAAPCGPLQLCTAPDTCTCIPGFTGFPACATAQCVQTCQNGGVCFAPDTCACRPGWFDPNCTTTVCAQTCGNGGNCTDDNTCRCPTQWQGSDCRVPVCTQVCLNGGFCSAPDTCTCPPSWSSHDCSKPVCHQGFFRADPYPQGAAASGWREPSWLQFEPCDYTGWCASTDEFECYQLQRLVLETQLHEVRNETGKGYDASLDPYQALFGLVTGRPVRPSQLAPAGACFPIELGVVDMVPYRLELDDGNSTGFARYSALSPYGWGPTSSTNPWSSALAAPSDRQVALVSWKNVTQGVYVCANGGNCTSPDVCACAPGWVGFDCRTPVCLQGFYYPNRTDPRFPGPQGTYWGSPRTLTVWESPATPNGKFPGHIHDTPNFHSQSFDMDPSLGLDVTHTFNLGPGSQDPPAYTTYEGWRLLGWWVRQLTVKDAAGNVSLTEWRQGYFNSTFNRTCPSDRAKELDLRYWLVNGSLVNATYVNGSFVGGSIVNATTVNGTLVSGTAYFAQIASRPVDDTMWAFAPRITYTNATVLSQGRWYEAGGECVDEVLLGCFNSGVCGSPNECACSTGWEGNDCSLPQCYQSVDQVLDTNLTAGQLAEYPATLLREGGAVYGTPLSASPPLPGDSLVAWRKCPNNGNCTRPDTCTCEKGWTGDSCLVPLCSNECFNGGYCSGPDTCTCIQVPTTFVDARGQPLFVKPDGDAQYTGWTGFDCNTPICTQAAMWVLNDESGDNVVSLLQDTGKPLVNDGTVFQAGCSDDSFYITSLVVTRKSATLCHIAQWYLGSYLESWANDDATSSTSASFCVEPQSGGGQSQSTCSLTSVGYPTQPVVPTAQAALADTTISLYSPGRTVRVNFPNYIKTIDPSGLVSVTQGPEIAGEGLYACYNTGACVSPDLCQCTTGWGGYDCNVPQCDYVDVYLNAISGCSNGGICFAVNLCSCPQVPSLLWAVHDEPKDALTGWTARDCSEAICTQGYSDTTCKDVPPGAGGVASMGQGCYRCYNGGNCTAPDFCLCPVAWTGYDCRTPVCVQHATRQTITDLVTIDPQVITTFEYDPCGVSHLVDDGSGTGRLVSRGNCTRPNTCTCLCRLRAIMDASGHYVDAPWTDSLHRPIPAGFIFGRYNCLDGYEGSLNPDGTFSSCHLQIYVPSFLVRNSVEFLAIGASLGIALLISSLVARRQLRIRAMQIKTDRRRTRRMEEAEAKEAERLSKKKVRNVR